MTIRHLTQQELAHRWRISPRTLERWRWEGEGPTFVKMGGRVVYRIEDIETFEDEQRRSSTARSIEITIKHPHNTVGLENSTGAPVTEGGAP